MNIPMPPKMRHDDLIDLITNSLEHIRSIDHDPEAAHGAEDCLFEFVLEQLTYYRPSKHVREIVNLTLQAKYIEFERWYA